MTESSWSKWLDRTTGRPLDIETIREVERQCGWVFPADYVAFLQQHNGAYLRSNFLSGTAHNGEVRWGHDLGLFALVPEPMLCDILTVEDQWSPILPPNMLIIGCLSGSNGLAMSVRGDTPGEVWICSDLEYPEQTECVMYFVAKGFTETINKLQAEEPPEDALEFP